MIGLYFLKSGTVFKHAEVCLCFFLSNDDICYRFGTCWDMAEVCSPIPRYSLWHVLIPVPITNFGKLNLSTVLGICLGENFGVTGLEGALSQYCCIYVVLSCQINKPPWDGMILKGGLYWLPFKIPKEKVFIDVWGCELLSWARMLVWGLICHRFKNFLAVSVSILAQVACASVIYVWMNQWTPLL